MSDIVNDPCKICGETVFSLREGFYYCDECGTKHDQIREVDVEDDFNTNTHQKVKVIKQTKNGPQLTSWECYNYILRGMVEELLNLGAKKELKTMSLQIWAAYLRRMEVAFFNKKNIELPKLGVRFVKKDAQTLYNYGLKSSTRKRKRDDNGSESSKREFRKAKRNLDHSIYSESSMDLSQSSNNTSSTCKTNQPIRLQFSSHARKHLKTIMSTKHLRKHEEDGECNLQCHTISQRLQTINRRQHDVNNIRIKHIYSILSIALNLIEDDIQLSDLVRFIGEGHFGNGSMFQYFPENISQHLIKVLETIEFFSYPIKYTDKQIREHAGLMAKSIGIYTFKVPKINKLVQRYVKELNLPTAVSLFVERLINLLPPKMQTRVPFIYSPFEARAMAYIVFALKLIFGLDGHTEKLISKSAQKINSRLEHLNSKNKSFPKLFVWTEWLEYIEMRKIIVSQHNSHYCRQFHQCQSTAQHLEEISEEVNREYEQNMVSDDSNLGFIQKMFENFQNIYDGSPAEQPEVIQFSATLTPGCNYMKQILLHYSRSEANLNIPDFMKIDHSQRTINSYLNAKTLREFMRSHSIYLKIEEVSCTMNRKYVGVFHPAYESGKAARLHAHKVDYDISAEEWRKNISPEPSAFDLEFKPNLQSYHKIYQKRLEAELLKRREFETGFTIVPLKDKLNELENSATHVKSESNNINQNNDLYKKNTFDVFNEENMNPLQNINLHMPRRNVDDINIFEDLSDEGEEEDENLEKSSNANLTDNSIEKEVLMRSRMDCWMLLGFTTRLKEVEKKMIETTLPRSFFWLLDTCASTIGVEWFILYEQLMTIELMFTYGIEDLDDLKDCVRFRYNNPIKDINMLVNTFREIW